MGRLVGKRAVETSIDIASGSIPIYNKEYRIWETINLSQVSGSDFPFTGSAVISGSLTVEGTTNLIGSSGSTVMTMNTDTMVFTGSFITTGSIENTGSLSVYGTIGATSITSSLLGTASYAVDSLSGSYAVSASYLIGAPATSSQAFSASYVSGSNVDGTVSSSYTASIADNAYTASYISGSNVEGTVSSSYTASIADNAYTASFVLNAVSASYATQALTASHALTASSADNLLVRNVLSGSDALFSGTITAQTLHVQTVSSSVVYSTGSNKLGSTLNDIQQLTGSVGVTGSLTLNNIPVLTADQTGSFTVATASFAYTASYISGSNVNGTVSSSFTASIADNAYTASYILNAVSASYAYNADFLDGKDSSVFATTGSNQFSGSQIVSGNLELRTNNQSAVISNYYKLGADGLNLFAGNGGLLSTYTGSNTYEGSYNTSYGINALLNNTRGLENIAIGWESMYSNTVGTYNIAIGDWAMHDGINGDNNTAVGHYSLTKNSYGYENVAVGISALLNNSVGSNNTAVGTNALIGNTSGSRNVGLGWYAGGSNITGSENIFIGWFSGPGTFMNPNAVPDSSYWEKRTWIGNGNTVSSWLGGRLLLGRKIDDGVNMLQVTGSAVITGSLNVTGGVTGSFYGTSSYALDSNLLDGKDSTTFATTGSNVFSGSQTIGGNLFMSGTFPLVYNNDPANNLLFGLFDGSTIHGPYYQLFGNQYANLSQRGGAEFIYDIRNNADANFHISSFNGSTWTQKFLVNDTGVQITGSLGVTQGITGSLFGTASYALQALTASNALTASSADNFLVRNVLSGSDALFTGTVTAQTLHVQTVSSSVVYSSGSNKLGSLQSDVQQLTGSVGITGSLRTVGSATFGNGSATANGEYAIAFGSNNHANGNYSIAHGGSSQANGVAAHAEGNSTQANGNWSHTEGNSTVVSAGYGHAEGISTTVGSNGDYAHAEGESTLANGRAAHAEGLSTAAIGESSHAEGRGTIASGSYQHAEGTFNLKGNTTSLLVIGNGSDNNNRSDILRIDPTNVQITGSLSVTSGITGSLEGTAATASYVVTSLTSSYVSGSNIKGTVSSSYTASIADNAYTASYIQNAQTASYVINALSASYISGSNVNGTVSSSYTASISDNAYSASYISGSNVKGTVSSSYTASIADNAYTASYVQNAITSSYVNTASYALDANLLDGKDSSAFASTGSNIFSGSQYIYSGFRMYTDAVENYSGNTLNLFGDVKFNGNDNSVANNLSITGSLNAPNITGSLLGTASYANSSLSASYAVNSTSASSALYANNATSASYAVTSSYAVNALSASFAPTASFALNASDILTYVKNSSGAQINKGTVVRISGATGDNPLISTASYDDDPNSANTLGITNETIANDSFGYVMTEGKLLGINTNGFTVGQLLYLGPTGSIIGTAPVAPLHAVRLGQVLRNQLNAGSMYVRIDNGYELGELHDVYDTSTTSSFGDLLVRSGSVWTNSKQLTGSYGLTGSFTATSFTGSIFGTASYANTAISASYASSATTAVTSSYPFFVTGSQYAVNSSIVTSLDGRNFAPDVEESVLLGVDAGVGSNEIFQNVIVGKEAGASTTNAAYMALLGYQAGYSASNAQGLVAIGAQAGYAASQSRYNNIIGGFAGNSLVNVEYSTAIGSDSLNSAMSSYGLIAIGNSTGNNSKKNDETIFIGNSAGSWAVSSSYSTFVGLSAGYGVKNTTSSIFIGNNTGRGPGNVLSNPYYLGRNNIIIGTDITLPVSSSDSINIGGLIFGTGSHYSDAFNPTYFSGSANGKIGINQPLPKYELDVAGAGNFTNGLVVTGSVVATSFTGSLFGTSSWAQKAVTASYAVYADAVGTIVSGAIVTTGSNIFIGNQTISGSATITGNLTVYGTSSFVYVTASQLYLTASFLSLNIFEPAERFGGIIVYDSGSLSHQATASLAWDSLKDRWVYQNASGSTYSGGIFISGPRNTGSLGDEPTLTNGRIPKSVGGDHIDNSIMSEISSSISVSGSLTVTGSLNINNVAFNGNTTGVITGGNQVLVSTATGSFTSAFYNYTLASGSNARAGQFIVVWNGTTINYTDVSTTDIGNTSNVILTASLSGNNVNVSSLIPSNNWVVKTTVNLL